VKLFRGDFSFFDIGGIFEHHCLEDIVSFVDIGGIVDHHCLELIVCFEIPPISKKEKSPLNSDGHTFHQYQQSKQSPLNSDGHTFHQYQQSKQSPILMELLTITV
jgi:hypothetical protein